MITSIVDVERWLQDTLRKAMDEQDLPGGVVTIPGLPGKGQHELERTLRGLFATLPAVGTYIPSGVFSDTASHPGHQYETDTVWVLCAASNSRAPGAALRGDRSSLGAWDLVTRVVQALSGLGSIENIQTCMVRSWNLLWCNSQIAVCAIQVDITIYLPLPRPDRPEGWAGSSY